MCRHSSTCCWRGQQAAACQGLTLRVSCRGPQAPGKGGKGKQGCKRNGARWPQQGLHVRPRPACVAASCAFLLQPPLPPCLEHRQALGKGRRLLLSWRRLCRLVGLHVLLAFGGRGALGGGWRGGRWRQRVQARVHLEQGQGSAGIETTTAAVAAAAWRQQQRRRRVGLSSSTAGWPSCLPVA